MSDDKPALADIARKLDRLLNVDGFHVFDPKEVAVMQRMVAADLVTRVATMEAQIVAAAKASKETADMVKDLHDCLMKQQPGHDGSFMDRATTLLLNVESGSRLFKMVILVGKVAGAIGAIAVAWVAMVKFGIVGGRS